MEAAVRRLIVMGVAGSGKTTIGMSLAERLGAAFVDADTAHPPENIEKMSAGLPLSDADRWPWLLALRRELGASSSIVITCSALRRSYRDLLRDVDDLQFVFLDVDRATALERLNSRAGHFMKAEMIASQFADLERPDSDEIDVSIVDGALPVSTLVDLLVAQLGS